MSNRLYVGNLSYNTAQADLEAAFAAVGEVREVAIPTDRETGRPRGFAFVTMNTPEGNTAVLALNGTEWNGRALTVNVARPREDRSSRGYGSGNSRQS